MLRRLIDELRARGPLERGDRDLAGLLSRSGQAWHGAPGLASRPGAYTRTCAYRSHGFEVLLLNWDAGAASPIHDHGGQHCWMVVLDGELEVENYARTDRGDVAGYARIEARDAQTLGAGAIDMRSGPFDLHRVAAPHRAPAVSLHVYAAPLNEYFVYDPLSDRCERAAGAYDAVLSLYVNRSGLRAPARDPLPGEMPMEGSISSEVWGR